jgi:ubiquinone/menaquinone biosynthesis C-methylase UbiE
MSVIQRYYDENTEYEWERLERHRTEFAVTLRALGDYFPAPTASVLDIGSGPGRYAIELTRQGYRVTLLDLAAGNLAFAQDRAAEAGVTLDSLVQGDATALPALPGAPYDAVLLLGPLYHLRTETARQAAVAEAWRVLRPGGVLAAAFICRFAPLRFAAQVHPTWSVERAGELAEIMTTGLNRPDTGYFIDAYFAHPTEIRPLLEGGGFETLALIGCEGVVARIEEGVNTLSGAAWEAWVELNYRLGQDPSLYGAAEHLLYIGKKA